MPVSVYGKVFSSAEKGFISATNENLCCLKSLSAHFFKNFVRILDRGFDGNDYYRYFLRNHEKFVIRAKKNRNVIYKGRTQNIMDVAEKYKGTYRMDFMDKRGKRLECKISYIPVRNTEKEDTIFMLELLKCSKRIFYIPKFIFYTLGYAVKRILAGTRSGVNGFLLKKVQSQQLTLVQCFGIEAFGG